MKRFALLALVLVATAGAADAQIIPRLPGRGAVQQTPPQKKDSLHDSTRVVWPTPDSAAQVLLAKKGYSVTKYQGDTAYFDAQHRSLDLLAAKKRRAIVTRDSQTVVSDSGIYYSESSHHVTTGGHYILSNPSSGQADITDLGHGGRVDYSLEEKSVRVSNARMGVNNGQMWYMNMGVAKVVGDSTGGKSATVYAGAGSMTSCDDTIPDYHFEFKEAKRTSGNTLVAAPAILYIKDIPVMWLPFIFTDSKSGRHSGIIVPQFGLGDIVRNSPSYRRNIDHFGYYWALNDYAGLSTWIDWRSAAGSVPGDPGWLKLNSEWDYKWLDRFLGGRIGFTKTFQRDGSENTAVSWTHSQDFSHDSHLNLSANYVTNTTLQRQNTFNPYAALATIASQATYQEKLGPASLSIGATRKQYPGRPQVDETFPTVSLTSTSIAITKWLNWTPSFSYSHSGTSAIDQPGLGQFVYRTDPTTGLRDSTESHARNSEMSTLSFDTPFQIFGRDFKNSFRLNQQRNNFPQTIQLSDFKTGQVIDTRIFAATYRTDFDWIPDLTSIGIPGFGQNRFNFSPTISFQNVDPGPYWVASEQTDGKFVHQSKRITAGVSASPTLYALFQHSIGPFSAIRHSISPTLSFTLAPATDVSDEYLKALGRTRAGYLGNLAQQSLSFGLTQNFEAKIRNRADTTGTDHGTVIKLLSITMTPLAYDLERAKHHKAITGLTTDSWGYNLASDLLPGFDFSSSYSLFEGSTQTDTARFKPYLTTISANFSIGRDQNPFTAFAKLLGKANAAPPQPLSQRSTSDSAQAVAHPEDAQSAASQAVGGNIHANDRFIPNAGQGWHASLSLSRSSPRPPTGTNIINFDPRARCATIAGANTLLFDTCIAQLQVQPTTDTPIGTTTVGGPQYNIPPTTSINGNVNFNLTPKWTAAWQTTYDLERHEFASHIVSLQRELHDWRAIFGFTQSPNGNFSFNFTIALKAEPDIKFDYNRSTVRSGVPF
ncbi:MAG: putative LPS assembly protein LptD [Gemmatimonadaceae bacterium]